MDAANEKNSLIPASAKSTSGEPGADSKVHEQNLQQGVAENLPQPFDVSPSEQEESFVEKVGEDLEALNPFDPKTVRTAPNTDKKLAKEKGWNSVKVIQETSKKLFYHFIVWLLGMGNAQGKIHIESATAEKDRFYLNEFSYFLAPGCKELSVDFTKIQDILTSISFVTKRNHDIEEQIADLFAYAARCKFLRLNKIGTFKVGSYEDRMIKILESKLFKKPFRAKEKKMKFYESIEPFCILPKT